MKSVLLSWLCICSRIPNYLTCKKKYREPSPEGEVKFINRWNKLLIMNLREALTLLLPLILIPITLYGVLLFGHDTGNVIIGIAFFIGVIKFTKTKEEKRFMIVLAIFSMLFEIANVAIGFYKYLDVVMVPNWIGLGWGVLGLYLIRNSSVISRISDQLTYFIMSVVYLSYWLASGMQIPILIVVIFAIATIYLLSLSSKFSTSFFGFASLMGVIIEFSGTELGIWNYLDNFGAVVFPNLAHLGMSYAAAIAFVLWLVKVE